MAAERRIVAIPDLGDRRYKKWAKRLTSVDRTKSNGYCFEGDWLRMGSLAELPIGSLVLVYGERGSRAHHQPHVTVLRVRSSADAADAFEILIYDRRCGQSWALDVRDEIADILEGDTGVA